MSVYRDTNSGTVAFSHPIGSDLTAAIRDASGTVLFTSDPIPAFPDFATGGNQYTLNVPWQVTQYDGKYWVDWTDGNGFTREQTFEVVTPIVDFDRLMAIYPDQFAAYGDMQVLETTVRKIIESFTGQRFGLAYGTSVYVGTGSGKLVFKNRLHKLAGVLGGFGMFPSNFVNNGLTNELGQLNVNHLGIIQDGWAGVLNAPRFLEYRESPPLELFDDVQGTNVDGVIRVPGRFYREADKGAHYQINGFWGYDAVPEDVQQAALLLASDYMAGDSEYRDRYLSILKIQQDSFTYHAGAFRGTGNVRADLLLGPYRRQNGMTII